LVVWGVRVSEFVEDWGALRLVRGLQYVRVFGIELLE
jgi:hypothetical protein